MNFELIPDNPDNPKVLNAYGVTAEGETTFILVRANAYERCTCPDMLDALLSLLLEDSVESNNLRVRRDDIFERWRALRNRHEARDMLTDIYAINTLQHEGWFKMVCKPYEICVYQFDPRFVLKLID